MRKTVVSSFCLLIVFSFFVRAQALQISDEQARFVANKVWQNEGAGKEKYLIWWNEGEGFASVGIGHFIWFPKGKRFRFREVFAEFLHYLKQEGVTFPSWLDVDSDFPWESKAAFFRAKETKTKRYLSLLDFIKRTKGYQARFMAKRLSEALPKILNTVQDPKKRAIIKRRFEHILYRSDGSVDEQGLYILIDYTNFKGEGILPSERYKGKGWGLLQVLEEMDERETNKYKAFRDAAKYVLSRRIENSPSKRGEERWRKGWNKRLDTYLKRDGS